MKAISVKVGALCLLLCSVGISSCQKQKEAKPPMVNPPPAIRSVKILPENPTRGNELSALIESQDSDGDAPSFRYQWMKNGEVIPLENNRILKNGNFRKGDSIAVIVTASNGTSDGNPASSTPVKIANSVPVIQEVWIEPRVAYANDRVEIHTKDFDVDGDRVYQTFQWEKNGRILPEENAEVLERGKLKKGDSIVATAMPDDKEAKGFPKRSKALIISNSPPIIVSSPPTTMDGTKYTYQVRASDPDNDAVTFGLTSSPKGMRIDPKTGIIQWEIKSEDKGDHPIEIEASDRESAKSFQRFTLKVAYK